MERRLQPSAELGDRRDLGATVYHLAGPGGRHRGPELGGIRRLHGRSGTSACGWSLRKRGAPADEPADHASGRSRGGLTTKIHLADDSNCRPLAFVLTAGQPGDAPALTEVMARLRVPRRVGRPRTRPDMVLADKAYSSRVIRKHLRLGASPRGLPSGQPAHHLLASAVADRLCPPTGYSFSWDDWYASIDRYPLPQKRDTSWIRLAARFRFRTSSPRIRP
ncbi:transposase [Streptomyces sp. SID4915]|nr:transposase [Streptomyces sp. SID4915]